jgi:hypothetical protein
LFEGWEDPASIWSHVDVDEVSWWKMQSCGHSVLPHGLFSASRHLKYDVPW